MSLPDYTVPPTLKAWLDRKLPAAVARQTFHYMKDKWPQLNDKTAVIFTPHKQIIVDYGQTVTVHVDQPLPGYKARFWRALAELLGKKTKWFYRGWDWRERSMRVPGFEFILEMYGTRWEARAPLTYMPLDEDFRMACVYVPFRDVMYVHENFI